MNGQVENLTFEEYLRGVFEINNGIENDPDNLVRIHAPELLKLARKQEQPEFPTTDEEVEKALSTIPEAELPDKYKTPDWLFEKREQPEVDLEKYVFEYMKIHRLHIKDGGRVVFENGDAPNFKSDILNVAQYFYELGKVLNARKEE